MIRIIRWFLNGLATLVGFVVGAFLYGWFLLAYGIDPLTWPSIILVVGAASGGLSLIVATCFTREWIE